MKKFRLILVAIAIVTMLSTVAFAGGTSSAVIFGDGSGEVAYDGNGSIVISVYNVNEVTLAYDAIVEVEYDETLWEYAGADIEDVWTGGYAYKGDGFIDVGADEPDEADFTVPANTKIFELKFNAISGGDVIGSEFTFCDEDTYYNSTDTYAFSGSVKVVEGGGSSTTTPSVGTVDVANKGTELTDNRGKKWKDVPTFEISAPITGKASSITAAITANGGTKDFGSKTYTFAEIENATLKFRIAVVGVPEGTTVTLDTPGITIN